MKLTPLTLSIVTTTLISGVAIALAWTGPTGSPFSNNTAAPVNVGGVDQTKSGGLSSNGFVSGGGLKVALSSIFGSLGTNRGYILDVIGGIGADNIYSYGNVCTNNTLGGCNGTGGVVIGGSNTAALVNITNTGNSFFNTTGNVGIGTNAPSAGKLQVRTTGAEGTGIISDTSTPTTDVTTISLYGLSNLNAPYTGSIFGVRSDTRLNAALTGSNYGGYFFGSPQAAGSVSSNNFGVYSIASGAAGSSVNANYGGAFYANPAGSVNTLNIGTDIAASPTGTIGTANYAIRAIASPSNTVPNNYGSFIYSGPTGTISGSNFGAFISARPTTGANITGSNYAGYFDAYPSGNSIISGSNYGLFVRNIGLATTPVAGNSYGVYINSNSVGVAGRTYGLYQDAATIDNYFAGDVGIGTTTPAAKLAVVGTIYSSTGGYRFPDGTTQTTAATGQWTTSGANIFNANTGNVGIGTTNPANAKLEVIGAAGTVQFRIGDPGNTTTNFDFSRNNSTGALQIQGNQTGANDIVLAPTSGDVGIGTTAPGAKLDVAGAIRSVHAGGHSWLGFGAGNNYLRGNTYFNGTLIDEDNAGFYLNPSSTSITNDLRANILYDRANTAYYVQPSQVSIFNDVRSSIFYDQQDTTYYADPNGTSVFGGLQIGKSTTNTSATLLLANNLTNHHIFNYSLDSTLYIGAGQKAGGVKNNINLYNLSCAGGCNVPVINLFADTTAMSGAATVGTTLTAGGVIRSTSGGFQFPDNTIQTTAAGASVWTTTGADIFNANTGNVGIGGAPSASKLHVQAASNPQIQLRSQSTGGRGLWTTVDDTNGVVSLNSSYGTVGAYPITFQLGNVEQMRLHSNGNIGLGRTAPTSKLEVGGDSVFFGTAGTSYFSSGTSNYIRGNTYFNGNLIDENNGNFFLNPDGTSVTNDLRANIFYDQGNTGYYVDPNATSNINNLQVNGDTNYQTVRSGAIGVYDPGNTQAVWAMANAYRLPAGGASTNYGNFYGIGWSYNPDYGGAGNNPQSKPGLGHQLLLMSAGVTRTAIGTGIWSQGIIHSSTGGFRFPDGTTQTTAATSGFTDAVRTGVAGDWNIASNVAASVYTNAAFEIREANFAGAQTGVAAEAPRIAFHWGGRVASQIGMDSTGTIRTYNNPGTGYEGFASGALTTNGVTTINAATGQSIFGYTASANYIRGANTYFNGSLVDENDSTYYLNPASTSITNDLRANIVYDQGNVGYYLDPAGSSNLNGVATQNITVASGIINSEWYRSSGNGGWYSNTHGGGIYMADSTYIRTYGSKSFYHDAGVMRTDGTLQVGSGGATLSVPNGGNTAVGYGLTVATTGTFGGNVTAPAFIYSSDERLKDNITPIQSSLEKVRALNGYTFNWKKDGKADVGLVAQQVETVFPELVHTDATTGLKSVQYGNLVAPLIEAVKELANSFDALATRVFNTEVRQTELEKQNAVQAQQIAELQRQIGELKNK